VLFVVRNNRAVKVTVQTGSDTGSLVEILSGAVQAGDAVVTLGNYELADGMAVQVEAGP
jgi:multidrug efflux pump subunit AcrA (membrane-fusion protein)